MGIYFPRCDGNDVSAELSEFRQYEPLNTISDGGEQNDRGNTDCDGRDGQHRAQSMRHQ